MATRTSVGSGLWSAVGTWDTGVPLDDDTVIVASGHVVTFNVDTSGFANGINGLTITGTLTVSTTVSSYLKMKASTVIGGAGTFNIGTSGSPIPFAVKFTLTGGAAWSILATSGLTMTVYGIEPTNTYIKLSGDEAIGQTELSVDTNVTGDLWSDGDTIYICDINGAKEVEERVIAVGGIAAGTITITAGLTAAKSTGAYIVLATRNVRIVAGSDNETLRAFSAAKFAMGSGEFSGNSTGPNARAYTGSSITLTGGVFHKLGLFYPNASWSSSLTSGVFVNIGSIANFTNCGISGGVFCGNSAVIQSGVDTFISGGLFIGNTRVANVSKGVAITGGTFIGNDSIVYETYSCVVDGSNATFVGNTSFFERYGGWHAAYNVDFNVNFEYRDAYTRLYSYSINHDKVDGAFKAWSSGGIVASQITTKPTGYAQAYQHAFASASYPCYWKKVFSVEPGKTIDIEVQLRKDASMAYLPRVYLMASIGDPLAGATPVDAFTMTDSTDTWESDTFTIVNSTNYDQEYTLWFVAQNASGNVYSAYDITTAGGGGGAVSIQPIQSAVRL